MFDSINSQIHLIAFNPKSDPGTFIYFIAQPVILPCSTYFTSYWLLYRSNFSLYFSMKKACCLGFGLVFRSFAFYTYKLFKNYSNVHFRSVLRVPLNFPILLVFGMNANYLEVELRVLWKNPVCMVMKSWFWLSFYFLSE